MVESTFLLRRHTSKAYHWFESSRFRITICDNKNFLLNKFYNIFVLEFSDYGGVKVSTCSLVSSKSSAVVIVP